MPRSKFVVEAKIKKSFKNEKVKGMFDIKIDSVKKEFDVNIPIEGVKWNIGLIIGSSGSGKTTIAKKVFNEFKLFNGFEWSDNSIIDDFNKDLSAKEITNILSKVGFSSPPDWLKPFAVLSNGQKMRVELARLILESNSPVIYDEFTSVVDRQVAKIGSYAISKFVKKENKQFIAVSCHRDIIDWLEPDWVFDVDEMKFKRGLLRRPEIKINIRKSVQKEWSLFKQFHYLSSNHNASAQKFIAEIGGEAVGWCSVIHTPGINKKMKRIHRIVVKPDYQGVGIGIAFLNKVAAMYGEYDLNLITGTPSFIAGLSKNSKWMMIRKPSRIKNTTTYKRTEESASEARLTVTFRYIGKPSGN